MQHAVAFYPLLLPVLITFGGILYVGWMARLEEE